MTKKVVRTYGLFLLIIAAAVAYLITSNQDNAEPAQPAIVTQTETFQTEIVTPTTSITSAIKPKLEAFTDLDKESEAISDLEGLLN